MAKSIGKADIIERVANRTRWSKPKVAELLDEFLVAIEGGLHEADQVKIRGWGAFRVVERAARPARNPRTGEEIQIPRRRGVKFVPSDRMLEGLQ